MNTREYAVMFQVEESHFWYVGMKKITQMFLQKYLPPTDKQRNILDAGCGTGDMLRFLQTYGQPYGIDIAKEAIKFCKKRGLRRVRIGSIDKLPYAPRSFDVVTCFDVLGQREVSSDYQAIKEFHSVLKPGGIFFLRIAAFDWLMSTHDRAVHTKHRYTVKEVEKLLCTQSFLPLTITYANSLLFPLVLLRLLKKRSKSENSEVTALHPVVNTLLLLPLLIERILLQYITLPFGSSVIAIAKRA